MRVPCLALVLAAAGTAGAFPYPSPPAEQVPTLSPVGQLRLAVMDLAANVPADQAPYVRYLSHYEVAANLPDRLGDWRRAFRHELNKRNAGKSLVREVEVDGPRGTVVRSRVCTLVRINILDAPNWTRTAWVLVADRDYTFREIPLGPLPSRETVFGRLVTGIAQNEKTLSAGFILNAWQLYRDMMELDRSQTGFDLLYAYERHPDRYGLEFKPTGTAAAKDPGPEPPLSPVRKWNGGTGPDGNYYPPGLYYDPAEREASVKAREQWRQAKAAFDAAKGRTVDPAKTGAAVIPKYAVSVNDAGKGQADFPNNLDDFLKRWGGANLVHGEKGKGYQPLLFNTAVGGIALAHDDDPANGSIVAAGGTRGVVVQETGDGFASYTADTFQSVDEKDIQENFLNLAKGKAQFDGGEALGSTPLGAQAEFLFGADKKVVAVANTNLAKHLEAKSSDPRYPEVRIGFCASCHAASAGYMSYVEQFQENRQAGVKYQVYDPFDATLVRDFFTSWGRRVKRWRMVYDDYLEITTAGPDGKPWTGAETWQQVMFFRDQYDLPLTLDRAAKAMGYGAEQLRWAILKDKEAKGPPQLRLNRLATDGSVSRRTWELNTYRDMNQWVDLTTPVKEKVRELVAPQVLEDAIRRLGYKEPPK